MSISLFAHPDGDGSIEFDGGILVVANDLDAVVARVMIAPDGMRDLAYRLNALADLLDGGRP